MVDGVGVALVVVVFVAAVWIVEGLYEAATKVARYWRGK